MIFHPFRLLCKYKGGFRYFDELLKFSYLLIRAVFAIYLTNYTMLYEQIFEKDEIWSIFT